MLDGSNMRSRGTLSMLALFVSAGCVGTFGGSDADSEGRPPTSAAPASGASPAPTRPNAPPPTGVTLSSGAPEGSIVGASAGGLTHVISEDWAEAPVPYGDNVKMLRFQQMQAEVERATGVTWSNWAANRAAFGGVDFRATFYEDRTPSATKLLIWRRMAFDVCAELVGTETNAPVLFTAIAPTETVAATDPKVTAQVKLVFARFFLEEPRPEEIAASTKALAATIESGGSPEEAWTALCVGYVSSMRFLTY